MYKINFDKLEPGMVWHTRGQSNFAKLIRKALNANKPNPRCWGSHDAITVEVNNEWFIGESKPLRACLTPIQEYLDEINKNIVEVRVYNVIDATMLQGSKAATYWTLEVNGTLYDFAAFPRLLFKALIADFSTSKLKWIKRLGDIACGSEWANWCTEGCSKAWKNGAGIDVWAKPNPTPFTTEKRIGKTLEEITKEIIVAC